MEPKRLRSRRTNLPESPSAGVAITEKLSFVSAAFVVRLLADEAYNLEAKLLRFLGLAVMLADQRLEALGQADEPDGQRAVLEHFAHLVVGAQPFSESIQTPCPIRKG